MKLLIFILKKVELTDLLIHELYEAGISGGTVIDGKGMAKTIMNMDDTPVFGMLRRALVDDDREAVKTFLFVVKDSQIDDTVKTIKNVVGDLKQPNTGILFCIPISNVEGFGEVNA